jgi:nucleotide-binding universal stress UspA family protein
MYKKIVAGTDLSETSKVAVRRAAMLAKQLDASLTLVHVGTDPGEPLAELARDNGAEVVVADGNPAAVLIAQADELEADLLVVGSVGMSGARRFALGNVPNKVSHQSSRDLLIVKTDTGRGADTPYRKILVGADASGTAMRAVEMASELSARLGVSPTVVTVFEGPSEHELEQMRAGTNEVIAAWHATKEQRETPAEYQWKIASSAQADDVLERAVDHAAKFDVEIETRAVSGQPAEKLLEIAEKENFDLICVGGVGMSGAARLALGNVPHRLSHHAPTDILILQTSR